MAWKSTYNCMLASLYHLLKHNQRLRIDFTTIALQDTLLHLYHHHMYLLPESPESTAERFAACIGARLHYPDVTDPDTALDYAYRQLDSGRILPVNINLRYDILTPLPFDNDIMHYHLITGRASGDRLQMYDQFENIHYEVDASHLKLAIDTAFNRRFHSRFTPFMTVAFTRPMRFVQEQLLLLQAQPAVLGAVARNYPYAHNLRNGQAAVKAMSRFAAAAPTAEEKYKYMNFQDIIVRIRGLFCETASQFGYPRNGELDEWLVRHHAFKRSFGLALVRRKQEDWRTLESEIVQLLDYERHVLAGIADYFDTTSTAERTVLP